MGCGITQAVVLSLVESFHHKGHHLYMDNLYTSPTLFAILSASGIGACGTLRMNRKGVPHSIKTSKLSKWDVVTAITEGDMLFLKWKDKREVSLLTTIHDDSSVLKERHSRLASGCTEAINKPYAIDQYNKFMDGVDKQDQFLSYYGFSRRTGKWWKKVFFHLLDTAVVNAYIMDTYSQHSSKKLTHVQFRIELAKQLLLQGNSLASPELPGTPSVLQPAARLTEQHLLKQDAR